MWNIEETEYPGNFNLTHFVINELYQKYQFQAHIFYTKNCDGANVWIRRHLLLQHDNNIIGFDTESKVIRKKGEPTHICLIQLAITPKEDDANPQVLLFHCRKDKELPQELIWVMESSHFLKCGVGLKGAHGDCAGMLRDFNVNMNGIVELFDHTKVGLKKSISKYFRNVQCPSYKSICTSNWLVVNLNNKQMMYASLDAIYGERLAVKIMENGEDLSPIDNAEDMIARNKLERLKTKREKQKRMREKQKQKMKENRTKIMAVKLNKDSEEFVPSQKSCSPISSPDLAEEIIMAVKLNKDSEEFIPSQKSPSTPDTPYLVEELKIQHRKDSIRHEKIKNEFKQKVFASVHSD